MHVILSSTITFVVWPTIICLGLAGCTHKIKVDPIKVEPIHVTLDVNLKVDRELETFFDFEDELADGEVMIDERNDDADPTNETNLSNDDQLDTIELEGVNS